MDQAQHDIQQKPQGEIILYQPDETVRLEVRLEDDTVWLTQQQMAELFQTTKNNVTLHIGNVYKEKELEADATSKESLLVRTDELWHCGASFKDLGRRLFAIDKMAISKDVIMNQL